MLSFKKIAPFILVLISVNNILFAQGDLKKTDNGAIILESFNDQTVNQLPKGWYDRNGDKRITDYSSEDRKLFKYSILEEGGNKFLRYSGTHAMHINFPLIDKNENNIYNIDLYETPVLSWKVRAYDLPEGANEDDNDKNDSVASVYVVFGFGRIALFKKVPKTIRYTWSTTLPKGTETSKLFGNQQIKVVKSGNEDLGEWITFEVNLVEDYKRMFGNNPPSHPLAILILSDGDSTGSYVKADYDDIMLKAEK